MLKAVKAAANSVTAPDAKRQSGGGEMEGNALFGACILMTHQWSLPHTEPTSSSRPSHSSCETGTPVPAAHHPGTSPWEHLPARASALQEE